MNRPAMAAVGASARTVSETTVCRTAAERDEPSSSGHGAGIYAKRALDETKPALGVIFRTDAAATPSPRRLRERLERYRRFSRRCAQDP